MSTLVCKHDIYTMQSRNKLIRPVSGTKDDFNLEATLAENSRAKVQAKSEVQLLVMCQFYSTDQFVSICMHICVCWSVIYTWAVPLRRAWPGIQWSDTPHFPSTAGRYGCTDRGILHQIRQQKTGTRPWGSQHLDDKDDIYESIYRQMCPVWL